MVELNRIPDLVPVRSMSSVTETSGDGRDSMDSDDRRIGKILTRRDVLRILGVAGAAAVAGCRSEDADPTATLQPDQATTAGSTSQASLAREPSAAEMVDTAIPELLDCVVRPELTAGPYHIDVDMLRSDITEGKAGRPLSLTFRVLEVDASGCRPMPDALVEIWHCDKDGVYSGVDDLRFDTSGQTWLRGAQRTDDDGEVTFQTIYPGWYPGRCVHIHFRVLPTEDRIFTSQLFFPDEFNEDVISRAPYEKGVPDRSNRQDGIFQDSLVARPSMTDTGVEATFAMGIDLSTIEKG